MGTWPRFRRDMLAMVALGATAPNATCREPIVGSGRTDRWFCRLADLRKLSLGVVASPDMTLAG